MNPTPHPTPGFLQSDYDYRKYAILYVDDEEKSLKYFTRAFEDQFRIYTANGAREGLRVLEAHQDEIGLIMSDQRMPGEKGVWFLEQARQLKPRVIRILATAFADMDAAIAAVNTGSIYKYISKPWDPPQLEATLKRGLEFFMVQGERDYLLREKISVLHNMMVADRMVSLGLLAAGLSHHIRNALVAVKTFLDLAPTKLKEENINLESLRSPEFWKEYHQKVQEQIQRINSLLQDLWTASERPSYEFRDPARLRDTVAGEVEALKEMIGNRRIEVQNDIPADLPELLVDMPKFKRLFELMLRDELVTLPAGSRIRLSASTAAHPLNGSSGESEVVFRLQDNGPGLPEKSLRQIFDPCSIRSDGPIEYGINLMASYFIVHHHGGRIKAQSQPGEGTTFEIFFPINPNQAAPEVEGQAFLQKVLLNDQAWEGLLAAE